MLAFRVLSPVLFPVAARPGDYLVLFADPHVAEIAVVRPTRRAFVRVRSGPPNYGAIGELIATGWLQEVERGHRDAVLRLIAQHPPTHEAGDSE